MKNLHLFCLLVLSCGNALSQTKIETNESYPKVVGYFSFILPVVAINKSKTTYDFSNNFDSFAIGFPVGINILYSNKLGFSFEVTPTVKATPAGIKTSNLLFDPGPMFRLKRGFAFIPRLAFETAGRYGITPVLTKVLQGNTFNYFVSVSVPVRYGNAELPSVGGNLQIGIIFK